MAHTARNLALVLVVQWLGFLSFAQADTVQKFVDNTIAKNKVAIFSKSYCGYSMAAKKLMKRLVPAAEMTIVEVDQRDDGPEIQNYLLEITGGRTVPRVFVGGSFIGGSDDTQALYSSGKLVPKLEAAGVGVLGGNGQAEL